jgi:Fur family ferric uptake transcriptional regulator
VKIKPRVENFSSFLRGKGLRFTRSRELIWEEIHGQSEIHRNAADIYQSLKKKGHRISLATIYRTLNLFVQTGLARAEDFGEKHSHFEPETPGTIHGHLICLGCGLVKEFEEEELKKELEVISQRLGFSLAKYSLQIFGFCQKCSHFPSRGRKKS